MVDAGWRRDDLVCLCRGGVVTVRRIRPSFLKQGGRTMFKQGGKGDAVGVVMMALIAPSDVQRRSNAVTAVANASEGISGYDLMPVE